MLVESGEKEKNEACASFWNIILAGTCGNRTHHGQDRCPTMVLKTRRATRPNPLP